MNKYITYFKHVIEHKKNVFIECVKEGMLLHAITHDLSKFRPSEFLPYAKFYHSVNRTISRKKSDETNLNFLKGWIYHQKRNKHHWNYWVSVTRHGEISPIPMPRKYIKQMMCDWKGMSRKFNDTPQEYYSKNKDDFIMHEETIKIIEEMLEI